MRKTNAYSNETNTKKGLRELAEIFRSCRAEGSIIDKTLYDSELGENPKRGCDKCSYTGMILVDNEYEHCECLKENILKTKMRLAGLRDIYFNIDKIDDTGLQVLRVKNAKNDNGGIKKDGKNKVLTIDEPIKDINKFIDNYKDSSKLKVVKEKGIDLIIEGPVGTGKTTIAHLIGKYALLNNYSVLFSEAQKLRSIWLKNQKDLSEFEMVLKEGVKDVDFLILDDLGNEYIGASGAQLSEMDLLFRERKSKKLVTIITTNLPETSDDINISNIKNKYNERIFSLLKERRVYLIMYREGDIREEQRDETEFLFT